VKDFFIHENDFRIFLPEVDFIDKSSDQDAHNSRRLTGIMSSERRDRQGEVVMAKGLEFEDFLKNGHFNDNHSQSTSAIVGYPESVSYHNSLEKFNPKLKGVPGWTCEGYVLKGTERSDGIWELAKALHSVPNRKLGFSIEGKVVRRADKTIEKAKIRNVAITNCPVNTDCTWSLLEKSFYESDTAEKSMSAGYGASPSAQSGGGAVRAESLESDVNDVMSNRKKKKKDALKRALELDEDELLKAMDWVMERRPDFDEDAAAILIKHLYKKGGRL
jgi:hypothetical protein